MFARAKFVVAPGSKEETQITKDGRTVHFKFLTPANNAAGAGNSATFDTSAVAKKLESFL